MTPSDLLESVFRLADQDPSLLAPVTKRALLGNGGMGGLAGMFSPIRGSQLQLPQAQTPGQVPQPPASQSLPPVRVPFDPNAAGRPQPSVRVQRVQPTTMTTPIAPPQPRQARWQPPIKRAAGVPTPPDHSRGLLQSLYKLAHGLDSEAGTPSKHDAPVVSGRYPRATALENLLSGGVKTAQITQRGFSHGSVPPAPGSQLSVTDLDRSYLAAKTFGVKLSAQEELLLAALESQGVTDTELESILLGGGVPSFLKSSGPIQMGAESLLKGEAIPAVRGLLGHEAAPAAEGALGREAAGAGAQGALGAAESRLGSFAAKLQAGKVAPLRLNGPQPPATHPAVPEPAQPRIPAPAAKPAPPPAAPAASPPGVPGGTPPGAPPAGGVPPAGGMGGGFVPMGGGGMGRPNVTPSLAGRVGAWAGRNLYTSESVGQAAARQGISPLREGLARGVDTTAGFGLPAVNRAAGLATKNLFGMFGAPGLGARAGNAVEAAGTAVTAPLRYMTGAQMIGKPISAYLRNAGKPGFSMTGQTMAPALMAGLTGGVGAVTRYVPNPLTDSLGPRLDTEGHEVGPGGAFLSDANKYLGRPAQEVGGAILKADPDEATYAAVKNTSRVLDKIPMVADAVGRATQGMHQGGVAAQKKFKAENDWQQQSGVSSFDPQFKAYGPHEQAAQGIEAQIQELGGQLARVQGSPEPVDPAQVQQAKAHLDGLKAEYQQHLDAMPADHRARFILGRLTPQDVVYSQAQLPELQKKLQGLAPDAPEYAPTVHALGEEAGKVAYANFKGLGLGETPEEMAAALRDRDPNGPVGQLMQKKYVEEAQAQGQTPDLKSFWGRFTAMPDTAKLFALAGLGLGMAGLLGGNPLLGGAGLIGGILALGAGGFDFLGAAGLRKPRPLTPGTMTPEQAGADPLFAQLAGHSGGALSPDQHMFLSRLDHRAADALIQKNPAMAGPVARAKSMAGYVTAGAPAGGAPGQMPATQPRVSGGNWRAEAQQLGMPTDVAQAGPWLERYQGNPQALQAQFRQMSPQSRQQMASELRDGLAQNAGYAGTEQYKQVQWALGVLEGTR